MPVQNCLPFAKKGYVTALNGLVLGQEYLDPASGNIYKLVQGHTTFAGTTLADATALAETSTRNVVTDKGSSQGDTTYPVAAGVTDFGTGNTVPVSTSTTTYYFLVLVRGHKAAVITDGSTVAAGDLMLVKANTDGVAIVSAKTVDIGTTTLDQGDVFQRVIGRATAANSSSTVNIAVNVMR